MNKFSLCVIQVWLRWHKIGKIQVAGMRLGWGRRRWGVINLFNSYPGDRKNIWRDVRRGARGVIKIWGLKLKCTQPLPPPPTHLMINDSPPKTELLFVSWWNRSTAELFSCRNCIHFNSVYREDGRVYTVETAIKLLLRNRYDQVLQRYYSICAFL